MKEPWKPDERSRYSPSIDEVNREFIVSYRNLHGARFGFNH